MQCSLGADWMTPWDKKIYFPLPQEKSSHTWGSSDPCQLYSWHKSREPCPAGGWMQYLPPLPIPLPPGPDSSLFTNPHPKCFSLPAKHLPTTSLCPYTAWCELTCASQRRVWMQLLSRRRLSCWPSQHSSSHKHALCHVCNTLSQ